MAVLLPTAFTGCLAGDLFREPHALRPAFDGGEHDVNAAMAAAGAAAGAAEKARRTGSDANGTVGGSADNVVVQGGQEAANRSEPRLGQGIWVVRESVRNAGASLEEASGEAADRLAASTDAFQGIERTAFEVDERARRVHLTVDVVLVQSNASQGSTTGDAAGVIVVRLLEPDGTPHRYVFNHTRSLQDVYATGTRTKYEEIIRPIGGSWRIEVDAKGEGAYRVQLTQWVPEHDDWKWWQSPWRGGYVG